MDAEVVDQCVLLVEGLPAHGTYEDPDMILGGYRLHLQLSFSIGWLYLVVKYGLLLLRHSVIVLRSLVAGYVLLSI